MFKNLFFFGEEIIFFILIYVLKVCEKEFFDRNWVFFFIIIFLFVIVC